jgi:broad specificity phosphatase PhoE
MSEIRLIIARHGETDYNRKGLLQGRGIDAPLNETGRLQAARLAGYLKTYPADKLICSSLQRTWQTAEPLGQPAERMKELDEMDFGHYEGKPYLDALDELNRIGEAWKTGNVDVPIPGGESPRQVFERANGAVERLLKSSDGTVFTMVLHGRLIRILLSEWLGYGLRNMEKIEHENAAVYQLTYNGTFKAVYLNKTDHLKRPDVNL